jgi:CopG family nickel-responsive transcriptional regulator
VLSALHVHLDHENCLEVTLLRGPTRDLRSFAEALIAETGVRHGHIHLTAVEVSDAKHQHSGQGHSGQVHTHGHGPAHRHLHLKPKV